MNKISAFPLRHTLLAASLGATLLLQACGNSETKLMASARDYLDKGERKEAIIQLKTVLQKNPQSGEARLLMGRALLDSGDATGAAVELEKALEMGASSELVVPLLAKALVALNEGAKAISRFGEMNLVDGRASSDLKTTLAAVQLAQGNRQAGRKLLDEALQLDADNSSASLLNAQLMAGEGQYEKALAQVDALLSKSPKLPAAHVLKGSLSLVTDNTPAGIAKAKESFEEALKHKADHVQAHLALLALAQQEGKPEGLRARWEGLHKAAPRHPIAMIMETEYALREGRTERANELTQQLLRGLPDDPRVRLLASRVALAAGSPVQAEVHAARAVQLAPKWGEARRTLAQSLVQSGQSRRALELLQPLLEGERPDGEALALAGQALLQEGQAAKAETLLRKASQARPEDARLRTLNALAQLGRGNDGAAMFELESIASVDKGVTADLALISTRMRTRDFDGALRAAEGLQRKQADNPMPQQIAAQVHLAKGDREAARKSLKAALGKQSDYLPAATALAAMEMQDKRPEAARAVFEQMIKQHPKNGQAQLSLIQLRASQGATAAELRTALEAAVKSVPDAANLRLALVNHLLGGAQDKRAALTAAQEATAAMGDQPELIDALGRAQLANDNKEQAGASFKKLVALQPQNLEFQMRLAEAHSAMGEYDPAVRTLRKALELKADHLPAQQALIANLLALKRNGEADAVIKEIQTQRPQSAEGWILEGDVAFQTNRRDAAIAAYRTAFGKTRGTLTAIKLHAALTAAGKAAEANELASNWERTAPKDMAFLNYLSDTALNRKAWPEAEARLKALLKERPEDAQVLNNLAYTMAIQGKTGSVELAERANKLRPGIPALMDTLALALAVEKQMDRAIDLQKQAVAQSNNDHSLRLNLAKLYVKAGDKPAARKELEQLAALGDKFGQQGEVSQLLNSL